MTAIANNPSFAKKVGIPQSVGKDFSAADKGKTFNKGGATMMSKKAPNALSAMMARRRPRMGAGMPPPAPPVMPPQPPAPMGMKKGGKVYRFEEGGITERQNPEIDNATRARALAFVAKNEPSTTNYSDEEEGGGKSFTSKVDKKPPVAKPKNKFSNANDAMSRATNARNAAKTTREQAAKMTDPGNKAQLIKAAEDLESKAVQFQRGADFARSTTKFAKGGMAHGGMHKMPNGKMMKNSAMNKGGMPMKDGKPAFMKKFAEGGAASDAYELEPQRLGRQEGSKEYPKRKQTEDSISNPIVRGVRKAATYVKDKYGDLRDDIRTAITNDDSAAFRKGQRAIREKEYGYKKGGMPMKDGKPAFMMGKKKMMGGGIAKYAKGGGIESRGKTKGTIIRMAAGGSVSARADGIAQRGKTRC